MNQLKETAGKDELLNKFTARWHDILIEILQPWERGKVLDIPCYTGQLVRKLQVMGFQVMGADITTEYLQVKDIPFQYADMTQTMPFEDNSFDYVVCAEGIEHIEDQYQMTREFARVLKPGGRAIITTPNISSLKNRWKFVTRGAFAMFRDYTDDPDEKYLSITGHINPVAFPELKYMLQRYGFKLQEVRTNRYVGEYNIFLRLLGWLSKRPTRKKNPDADFMLKPELLYGEHIIVIARKM